MIVNSGYECISWKILVYCFLIRMDYTFLCRLVYFGKMSALDEFSNIYLLIFEHSFVLKG